MRKYLNSVNEEREKERKSRERKEHKRKKEKRILLTVAVVGKYFIVQIET